MFPLTTNTQTGRSVLLGLTLGAILTLSSLLPNPEGSTLSANAADINAIFSCSVPYAPVQSAPSGYVIGNCLEGVHLHRQDKRSAAGFDWDGGKIYGHFAECGWIRADYDTATSSVSSPACPSGSIGRNLSEFAQATNADAVNGPLSAQTDCNIEPKPPQTSPTPKCTDGSSVLTVAACPLWGNVKPWLSGGAPIDLITNAVHPNGIIPSGTRVKWRYKSRFAAADGKYYLMVQEPAVSAANGNWGFLAQDCLPDSLPYYTQVAP